MPGGRRAGQSPGHRAGLLIGPVVEDAPFRYTRKLVGDAFRAVAMPDSPYVDIQEKMHFPPMLAIWLAGRQYKMTLMGTPGVGSRVSGAYGPNLVP